MKNDKLILFTQYFFRLLSWTLLPAGILWTLFITSCFTLNNFLLESIFKDKDLGPVPEIPFSFILMSIVFASGTILSFFLYHSIAKLIKDIRLNGVSPSSIKILKFLSMLFMAGLAHDLFLFIIFKTDNGNLLIFLQALELIRPIIDWYHFIYVEFTGITNLIMFALCRIIIRFLEYHFEIRKEHDLVI